MKKNPGRKMRRQQQRELLAEAKKVKTYSEKEFKVEPHPNAIKANDQRTERIEQINKTWEDFKGFFNKATPLGRKMIGQQKAKQKRREQWKKELGLN